MYAGFADEGSDVTLLLLTRDADGQPVDPDAAPTFRVFGPAGAVAGGTGTATAAESGTVTGATNASPVEITSASHGLPTGAYVKLSSIGGNTAANGTYFVTQTGTNTFTLTGSTGSGTYTSGGSWRTIGLWKITLTGGVLASLAAGTTYTVLATWAVSSAVRQATLTFTVQ